MDGGLIVVTLIAVIGLAVLLLKGFDRMAGRGPKQVADGIEAGGGSNSESRRPCPYCAEEIKPEASICRFCKEDLPEGWAT